MLFDRIRDRRFQTNRNRMAELRHGSRRRYGIGPTCYNAEGVSGLFNRRPPDPPCLLSAAQIREEVRDCAPQYERVCFGALSLRFRTPRT